MLLDGHFRRIGLSQRLSGYLGTSVTGDETQQFPLSRMSDAILTEKDKRYINDALTKV
jgi:hypothetical protein